VLGLMVSGVDRPGYDIVRDTWTPMLGEGEFDTKWNRVLHDGLLPGSELPEVVPPAAHLTAFLAEPSAKAGKTWSSCSSRLRRFTTAASRTTGGCRSFPIL
jgi:hypothetical protein